MAVFGYPTIGAQIGVGPAEGWVVCCKFVTPNSAGVITKITQYMSLNVGTPTARAVIYSDMPGQPNVLLALGSVDVAVPVVAAWVDLPISYSFFPNTMLWLGVIMSGSTNFYYDDGLIHNQGDEVYGTLFTYPNPPNPWEYNTFSDHIGSTYATYDLANAIVEDTVTAPEQGSTSQVILDYGARVRTIRHTMAVSPVIIG